LASRTRRLELDPRSALTFPGWIEIQSKTSAAEAAMILVSYGTSELVPFPRPIENGAAGEPMAFPKFSRAELLKWR
jgi:hypothetical protein